RKAAVGERAMSELELSGYWTRRMGRRTALRSGAVALLGLAGAALVGCSSSSSNNKQTGAATGQGAAPAAGAARAPSRAAATANGTATTAAERPRRGGTLRLGSRAQPGTLDPHFGGGGFDERFEWFVYDNLVTFDDKGNANLNESLAQTMEQADKTTIV